jgi:hypothetical protein
MSPSAARKSQIQVNSSARPRRAEAPLVVYVGRSLDGTSFALDPTSQQRVRDAFAGASPSTRHVFISHDAREDLKHTVRRLEQQTAIVLTGVTAERLAERFKSISFRDPSSQREVERPTCEGLDETLTVMRLGLTGTLRRTFAHEPTRSLRRVARNVKRWKDEAMIRRWVALGIAEAQKGFRRVKGYVHMPSLVAALLPPAATVASEKKVA